MNRLWQSIALSSLVLFLLASCGVSDQVRKPTQKGTFPENLKHQDVKRISYKDSKVSSGMDSATFRWIESFNRQMFEQIAPVSENSDCFVRDSTETVNLAKSRINGVDSIGILMPVVSKACSMDSSKILLVSYLSPVKAATLVSKYDIKTDVNLLAMTWGYWDTQTSQWIFLQRLNQAVRDEKDSILFNATLLMNLEGKLPLSGGWSKSKSQMRRENWNGWRLGPSFVLGAGLGQTEYNELTEFEASYGLHARWGAYPLGIGMAYHINNVPTDFAVVPSDTSYEFDYLLGSYTYHRISVFGSLVFPMGILTNWTIDPGFEAYLMKSKPRSTEIEPKEKANPPQKWGLSLALSRTVGFGPLRSQFRMGYRWDQLVLDQGVRQEGAIGSVFLELQPVLFAF